MTTDKQMFFEHRMPLKSILIFFLCNYVLVSPVKLVGHLVSSSF